MGSCFGRCQCPCCDFLVLRQQDNIRIRRKEDKLSNPKAFVLRRQSSTLEFENLMFEFDVEQNTISTLVAKKQGTDIYSESKAITISKGLSVTYDPKEKINKSTIIQSSAIKDELPIIYPLMKIQYDQESNIESSESSHDPSRQESGGDTNSNHNELEWDDYDQQNFNECFNQETETLIKEIDEMKERVLKDT